MSNKSKTKAELILELEKLKEPKESKEPKSYVYSAAKFGSIAGISVMGLALLRIIAVKNPLLLSKIMKALWDLTTGLVTGGKAGLFANVLTSLGVFDLLESTIGQDLNFSMRNLIASSWVNLFTTKKIGPMTGAKELIELYINSKRDVEMGPDAGEVPSNTITPSTTIGSLPLTINTDVPLNMQTDISPPVIDIDMPSSPILTPISQSSFLEQWLNRNPKRPLEFSFSDFTNPKRIK